MTTPLVSGLLARYPSDMDLRADIQQAKDRIKLRFGYRTELKTLESVLLPGEVVEGFLFGKSGSLRGLIVLTDQRLLFHYAAPTLGFMSKNTSAFPLAQITSVHAAQRGLFAELSVTVASSAIQFTEVPRQYADEFVMAANQGIATAAVR